MDLPVVGPMKIDEIILDNTAGDLEEVIESFLNVEVGTKSIRNAAMVHVWKGELLPYYTIRINCIEYI